VVVVVVLFLCANSTATEDDYSQHNQTNKKFKKNTIM
jgi:hypothetical protein